MERNTGSGAPSQLLGDFGPEFPSSFRDSLKRDVDAALGKQVFKITKTEPTPIVKPQHMSDDLGGRAATSLVSGLAFSHSHRIPTPSQECLYGDINQMRAFCLEYAVAVRQGAALFKLYLPDALKDLANDPSVAMPKLLDSQFDDLRQLEKRIADVTFEIEAIADRGDAARRIMTIPGIGALGATAMLAAVGNGRLNRPGFAGDPNL